MVTGRPLMKVLNLGCMDYRRALRVQHHLAARLRTSQEQRELAPCSPHHLAAERGISEGQPPAYNVLILVEHPPVYTTGIRTKAGRGSYPS
jgi:lipoate-protein ligase B